MDVGRSISYVFEDPDWLKKVLIGGVLAIIPIFGTFVVFGYWVRTAINVANGSELPLPEWNDFGGDFMRGVKAFVALVIWAIPLFVLFGCGSIPLVVLSNSSNGAVSVLGALFTIGFFGVGFLLALAITFAAPVIIGRVVMRDSVAAAFEYNAIVGEARNNVVPLLVIVGMSIVLRFVAGFGIVLCVVGILFTSFLAFVMLSHLYGQLWRQLGVTGTTSAQAIVPGPTGSI
jgi:hypothetical protein